MINNVFTTKIHEESSYHIIYLYLNVWLIKKGVGSSVALSSEQLKMSKNRSQCQSSTGVILVYLLCCFLCVISTALDLDVTRYKLSLLTLQIYHSPLSPLFML